MSQEKYKCIKDNVKHPIVDLIINDCCPEFTVVSPLVHITFMMHTSSCSNHKGTMKFRSQVQYKHLKFLIAAFIDLDVHLKSTNIHIYFDFLDSFICYYMYFNATPNDQILDSFEN